jgi:hypothetical protein
METQYREPTVNSKLPNFSHMKASISIILITFFLFITTCLQAQSVVNIIPCNDYKAITFNGKTIAQINATNADPQSVQQLLGAYSSMTEPEDIRRRSFHYGDNRVGFTYDGTTYVTRITISNNQWPLVIQGITVKVGDSVTSMQQAFGSNLIIGQSQYDPEPFIAFGCSGYDEGIVMEIDSITNKIKKIVYFVSP